MSNPNPSQQLQGPHPESAIPATRPEDGARQPFAGPDFDAANGYLAGGPSTPQEGSGQGAPSEYVTGSQTGSDSEGHTPELPDYLSISATEDELASWEQAYAAGRAEAGIVSDTAAANTHVPDDGSGGYEVTSVEAQILHELYLEGREGVGNEDGGGPVGGWQDQTGNAEEE